ncbi:MAG: response regulator [Clostridia bacterium]|nr:response regulator [Clostridia bacterium]
MYRALIVDDEPIAIDSIEYIIKNNFKELEIGGRARSGREAVEKAYHVRPDIVLIDIKMPGINGLEAIRQIKDSNPDVHFIIISAYDYFDYAAEAMALGVVEYLLKPVKEAKLIEVLNKAIDTIAQRRKRISQELELKEKLEIIVPILENGFIHALCMTEDNAEELVNFGRLFDFESMGGYVMAIEFGDKDKGSVQNRISASVKTQNHYVDYRDILKSACRCIVGPIMLNRLLVYVLETQHDDSFTQKASAARLAKEFSDRVKSSFGDVSIGIGRYYKDVRDAKKSYQEAMQALQALSQSYSEDAILHVDDRMEDYEDNIGYEERFERDIYTKAATGDLNATLVAFDKIYDQMVANLSRFDTLKDKCIALVVGLANRWGAMAQSQNYYTVLNHVMSAADSHEVRKIIKKYMEAIVSSISQSRQRKISSLIEKADKYLQENYAEEITLEDIARVVNLSPYYFSRFYKEESGVNFIDRLITIRIDKAKQYFEKTDLSLKEVSRMVGYADPNYFSKLFKKVTGFTATEYKEYYRK